MSGRLSRTFWGASVRCHDAKPYAPGSGLSRTPRCPFVAMMAWPCMSNSSLASSSAAVAVFRLPWMSHPFMSLVEPWGVWVGLGFFQRIKIERTWGQMATEFSMYHSGAFKIPFLYVSLWGLQNTVFERHVIELVSNKLIKTARNHGSHWAYPLHVFLISLLKTTVF